MWGVWEGVWRGMSGVGVHGVPRVFKSLKLHVVSQVGTAPSGPIGCSSPHSQPSSQPQMVAAYGASPTQDNSTPTRVPICIWWQGVGPAPRHHSVQFPCSWPRPQPQVGAACRASLTQLHSIQLLPKSLAVHGGSLQGQLHPAHTAYRSCTPTPVPGCMW